MHSVIVNKSKRKFLIGEVLKSITIAKLVFLLMLAKKLNDFFGQKTKLGPYLNDFMPSVWNKFTFFAYP